MRKVLIITYYWPPSGGAGVQRWLKMSKYLPEFGIMPVILTVDPEYATYPATDHSLMSEVPEDMEVHRTKATDYFRLLSRAKSDIPSAGFANEGRKGMWGKIARFVRGNFFIPDPRRGWNRYAFRKACELIEKLDISHVITTSPPHSTQLIGLRIKRRLPGIRWIADLRDPWTDIYYYKLFYPTFISRTVDRYYERSVLKYADRVFTVGNILGNLFSNKLEGLSNKISVVPNGFDERDFAGKIRKSPDRFTITFTGTISESYPLNGFIDAVKEINKRGLRPLVRFVGIVSDNQKLIMMKAFGEENIEFTGYSDHSSAIQYMMNSSLLLLVIANHPDNRSFLSGKVFEYIASGTSILYLGPVNGEAAHIIEKGNFGQCFEYSDVNSISLFIEKQMISPKEEPVFPPDEYSRKRIAYEVARMLCVQTAD